MKWYRLILNLVLGVSAMISAGNVLAMNWNHTLILGETETFDHLDLPGRNYSGDFVDTGTFTLDSSSPVSVSIVDSQLAHNPEPDEYYLNISNFIVKDSDDTILYNASVNLVDAAVTLNALHAGTYVLVFEGLADGDWGGSYNVTVSAIPLPAAAWLFSTALIGFVTFSARSSV
jgi:hypothetical protein